MLYFLGNQNLYDGLAKVLKDTLDVKFESFKKDILSSHNKETEDIIKRNSKYVGEELEKIHSIASSNKQNIKTMKEWIDNQSDVVRQQHKGVTRQVKEGFEAVDKMLDKIKEGVDNVRSVADNSSSVSLFGFTEADF